MDKNERTCTTTVALERNISVKTLSGSLFQFFLSIDVMATFNFNFKIEKEIKVGE